METKAHKKKIKKKDASPRKEEKKSTNGRRSKKSLQTSSYNFDCRSSRNPLPKPKCRVTYQSCFQFVKCLVIKNNS